MAELVKRCVECGQPSNELEMTTDGLKCWSCIEDPHLDDVKVDGG